MEKHFCDQCGKEIATPFTLEVGLTDGTNEMREFCSESCLVQHVPMMIDVILLHMRDKGSQLKRLELKTYSQ